MSHTTGGERPAQEAEQLAKELRLHAHELVNGGTNASDLRRNLFAAAALLAELSEVRQALAELQMQSVCNGTTGPKSSDESAPVAAWLPIDTVPANVDWILAHAIDWEWPEPAKRSAYGSPWVVMFRGVEYGIDPTHWMPLPSPPKA